VPTEKRYRVFGLRAVRATVPATENPRVAGSIPALATNSIGVHSGQMVYTSFRTHH